MREGDQDARNRSVRSQTEVQGGAASGSGTTHTTGGGQSGAAGAAAHPRCARRTDRSPHFEAGAVRSFSGSHNGDDSSCPVFCCSPPYCCSSCLSSCSGLQAHDHDHDSFLCSFLRCAGGRFHSATARGIESIRSCILRCACRDGLQSLCDSAGGLFAHCNSPGGIHNHRSECRVGYFFRSILLLSRACVCRWFRCLVACLSCSPDDDDHAELPASATCCRGHCVDKPAHWSWGKHNLNDRCSNDSSNHHSSLNLQKIHSPGDGFHSRSRRRRHWTLDGCHSHRRDYPRLRSRSRSRYAYCCACPRSVPCSVACCRARRARAR